MTTYYTLMSDLTALAKALSESENFQEWTGSDTAAEALGHIYFLTADRDLTDQDEGYCCAVLSHGGEFTRERQTYTDYWTTTPEFKIEFVSLVDSTEADSDLFTSLLCDVSDIERDLELQDYYPLESVSLSGEDTPRRAAYGKGRVDWASVTLIVNADNWQGSQAWT